MLHAVTVLAWRWDQAVEIGISGIITALVIMSFMVVMMRLLQIVSERVENNKTTSEPVETISPPGKETIPAEVEDDHNRRLIAAISAAVTSYINEQAPAFKAGKISVTRQAPQATAGNNWRFAGRKELLQNRYELERTRRNKNRENL